MLSRIRIITDIYLLATITACLQAACALGQLERAEELVQKRIEVAAIFDEVVKGQTVVKPQMVSEGYKNSYWTYCLVLNTDNPDVDWYRFRDMFQKNGGDGYYAAWNGWNPNTKENEGK